MGDLAAQDSYDPFAAEKFLPPVLADQSKLMAGKDVDTLGNIAGGIGSILTLPERAIGNSANALSTGTYNPAPVLEAATLPMGTGAIAGVPLKGAETVLGAGAVRPKMGSLASQADYILPGDTRVSTRFPDAVKATEDPLRQHLSIGTPEMKLDPENFEYNTSILSNYPGFGKLKGMSADEAAQAYIDQAKGNLQYLYDRSPAEMRLRSPRWYEGANEITDALANRWGIPRQSASAAMASLSPQKDWFMNASLGERVGDIVTANPKATPDMAAWASTKLADDPESMEMIRAMAGKRLDRVDPDAAALFVRAYDEAHNARNYRSILPEGYFGDYIQTQKGEPAKVAWGTYGDIDKARRAILSGGDMDVISPLLGGKHKVRSFYNNIELPFDARYGDITGDTHQVAAAQLRPLSGASEAVTQHLASGGPAGSTNARSSKVSGVQGTYGLVADATRQFAAENGLLPRAGQSATWEPIRELFPADWKNAKNATAVDDIWRAHDRGDLTLDQARDAVFGFAGGIGTPEWARGGINARSPQLGSTYR
jgi:hypothetical protein